IRFLLKLKAEQSSGVDTETFVHSLISDGHVEAHACESILPLLRFPKPTYIKGLTDHADAFIRERANHLRLEPALAARMSEYPPCSGSLRVRNLDLGFEIDTGALGRSEGGEVRRAFGLARSFSFRTGVRDMTFEVRPGEVCYIYGASGSGKTC